MNNIHFTLCIDIHSFWQAGTGRGTGALLDMLAYRDADDLPCLPGRTVKGLLRDAVNRAEDWDYIKGGTTEQWFGSRAPTEANEILRLDTLPGTLRISDTAVPTPLGDYLRAQKNDPKKFDALSCHFYHPIYATAIDDTGTAKHASLRSTEVVIPLTLHAQLSAPADWPHHELEKCLPLIRVIGNGRNLGLGRTTVTLKKHTKEPAHA